MCITVGSFIVKNEQFLLIVNSASRLLTQETVSSVVLNVGQDRKNSVSAVCATETGNRTQLSRLTTVVSCVIQVLCHTDCPVLLYHACQRCIFM